MSFLDSLPNESEPSLLAPEPVPVSEEVEEEEPEERPSHAVVLYRATNMTTAVGMRQDLQRRGVDSQILSVETNGDQKYRLINGPYFSKAIADLETERIRGTYLIDAYVETVTETMFVVNSDSSTRTNVAPEEDAVAAYQENAWRETFAIVLTSADEIAEAFEERQRFIRRGVSSRVLVSEEDQSASVNIVNGPFYSRAVAELEAERIRARIAKDAYVISIDDSMIYLNSPLDFYDDIEEPQENEESIPVVVASENTAEEAPVSENSDLTKNDDPEKPSESESSRLENVLKDQAESNLALIEQRKLVVESKDRIRKLESRVEELESALLLSADDPGFDPGEILDQDPSLLAQITRSFSLGLRLSNIYEDNIDHVFAGQEITSRGLVPSAYLVYRSALTNPFLTVRLASSWHDYTNTEDWDRFSHSAEAVLRPKRFGSWFLKTTGFAALNANSEDREISDQIRIEQMFEYRAGKRHRIQFYGTWRVFRFDKRDDPLTLNPNGGVNFIRANPNGERFETGVKYERHIRRQDRDRFNRWTMHVGYLSPRFRGNDQLGFSIRNRRKFFETRLVEIEDNDFLRRDNRLGVSISWNRRLFGNLRSELAYDFESRGSNRPSEEYHANAFRLSLSYALFN